MSELFCCFNCDDDNNDSNNNNGWYNNNQIYSSSNSSSTDQPPEPGLSYFDGSNNNKGLGVIPPNEDQYRRPDLAEPQYHRPDLAEPQYHRPDLAEPQYRRPDLGGVDIYPCPSYDSDLPPPPPCGDEN